MKSLVEMLQKRCRDRGDGSVFTFLENGEEITAEIGRGELDARARALAGWLQAHGLAGERALLLYPPGLDFIVAFLACLYAGTVAVPAWPPRRRQDLSRLLPLLHDCRPRQVLTDSTLRSRFAAAQAGSRAGSAAALPGAEWLATDRVDPEWAAAWRPPPLSPDHLAFLQYTSGSTAAPKGVMVTHGNLLDNEARIQRAFAQSAESVVVGWLPLYHDMGLIGNVLQPLLSGGRAVLMSPLAFLQRPRRWLEAIGRFRATTSGGPSFAYQLCVRRIPEGEREGLDLSTWRTAFNGAEPVRAETVESFSRAFAPCGFERRAFLPCYGLAEATLFVAGGQQGEEPTVRELAPGSGPRVACGRLAGDGSPAGLAAKPGQRLLVVEPQTAVPRPTGQEGEIWVASPSVALGYWGRPEATEATFRARLGDGSGPYLRTGDLGVLGGDGSLFITGRMKDLLILRGRNVYPQDLEATAERAHPALLTAGAAAFSLEREGEERPVVAAEIDRRREGEAGAAAAAVALALAAELEAPLGEVVILRAGTLPRTTSGKVRRLAAREAFLAGRLAGLPVRAPEAAEPPPTDPAAERNGEPGDAARALRRWLAGRLGVDPEHVPLSRPPALDSLSAVELAHHLQASFGVQVPLSRLLGEETLAELAAWIKERAAAAEPAAGEAAPPGDAPAPLSYGQRALYFLQRLHPRSTAYNLALAARPEAADGAPVDREALAAAWAGLARRHPILRTTLPLVQGEPVQQVGAEPCSPLIEIPGEHAGSGSELGPRLEAEVQRPFDLGREGPARLLLAGGGSTLLLVIHHAAADFWSLGVLLAELGQLYAAEREGRPAQLPQLESTFAAHARRQQEDLQGPAGAALLAWWRERLEGFPTALEVPADRPRPADPSDDGAAVPVPLPPQLGRRLRALAAGAGASVHSVLLAAFAALLCRLSGQQRLLVGSPTAGRGRPELAGVVGYFANPLALPVDLRGDPSFLALLAQVRRTVLAAADHQDLPFPLLVKHLAPGRDATRSPLFQAAFVLEAPHLLAGLGAGVGALILGDAGPPVALGGLRLTPLALPRRTTPFELLLTAVETGDQLAASLAYRRDLFDPTTARRWVGWLLNQLEGAAATPGRGVAAISLLSAAERFQLLTEWGDGGGVRAEESTLWSLFIDQLRSRPEAMALVWEESPPGRAGGAPSPPQTCRMTYGELGRRAAALAHRLVAAGAGPERAVALCLPRSPELVQGLLAALGAGGFYSNLSLDWPEERLHHLLAEIEPAALLAPASGPASGPASDPAATGGRELPRLDPAAAADPRAMPPPPLPRAALADNLAYLIHTSGSTGRPKGIGISHRAAVGLVRHQPATHFGPGSRILQVSPFTFDASVLEIWGTLSNGGTLLLAGPGAPSLGELTGLTNRHRATGLVLASGLFQLVLEEAPQALAPVEQVIFGGDVLAPVYAARAVARLPRARLSNVYGPTEATVFVTAEVVGRGEAEASREPSISIGRPLPQAVVRLVGRDLRPVPPGATGEIALGGPSLARGYLQRPALTAESFVPDPDAGAGSRQGPGSRVYCTGDLARHLPDGRLAFLGRRDRQVKVRGFRVEPGEVESALLLHPAVAKAAVLARGSALVAYVVAPRDQPAPSAEELRHFLGRSLPAYLIPAAFVALPELPLTTNGKLDRSALPAPRAGAGSRDGSSPASELERRIAACWQAVLEEPEVGVEDNFFDLGGHSLAMLQIHANLEAELERRIPLLDLFHHPTVASLAAHLAREPGRVEPGTMEPGGPGPARMEPEERALGRRAAMARQLAARRQARELRREERHQERHPS